MNRFLFSMLAFLMLSSGLAAQVTGKWKTYGEKDGKEKSIIEIYEEEGKIYGKVLELLPGALLSECRKCPGDLKDKPIAGMIIMQGLTKTESGANEGKIMDPSSGKTYKCFVELESPDKLKVRGFIGLPALGKTQYWYRVKR